MQVLLILLLASLITYRVTRFLIADSLIDVQRDWVYRTLIRKKKNVVLDKLHDLLSCPYCLSVHIAWMTIWGFDLYGSVPMPVALWLATCAGAMIVWRYVEHAE